MDNETMRLIGLLAISSALLSGCSTSPISSNQADPVSANRLTAFQSKPAGQYGTLIVTRDSGFTGSACNTILYIDGEKSAAIGSGETTQFYLPAGERIIGVNSTTICGGGLKERSLVMQSGDTKKYRISIDTSMSMDISPTVF
ncbi:hypothetical protein EX349_26880 [Pseudomonas protegens]|uniref:hypothetical protein n=2 Tax=Pseudomonas protegens TaxID=380021 RepID=UPI001372E812|nr:hypothetical protein [Pseudomonas protegens]NAN54822.1 hypothetical protein [Pseudomonas protegens]NUE73822.1 hypothetical protein [Pseudomonas protegens]